jgi:acyl carrier protein
MSGWPQEFDDLLAKYLSLEPGAEFDENEPLAAAGLDSMGMVGLMLNLEETFEFELPEEDMTVETFHSAATLWSAVSRHLALSVPERDVGTVA